MEFRRARQADGAGAQTLHGEGKVGQAIMPGEGLAREADQSRQDRAGVAGRVDDGNVEQARLPQSGDQLATGAVDIAVVDVIDRAARDETIEPFGVGAVGRFEKRPVEVFAGGMRAHRVSSPLPSLLPLAGEGGAKRRMRGVSNCDHGPHPNPLPRSGRGGIHARRLSSPQFPSNCGLRLAAKASKARRKSPVAMQIACACASNSMISSRPIAHS